MNLSSTHKLITIVLCCASFFALAQNDDGLQLLEDADDDRIKFENHYYEALKYKAIGNYSRAIAELEKCQQLYKDELAVDFEFAKNYFKLNSYNEAQLYIEKALQKEPHNFWFLQLAKRIYLKQFNYKLAITTQQAIIKIDSKEREDLVLIYLQAKERKKAAELIEQMEKEGFYSSKLESYKTVLAQYELPKETGDSLIQEEELNLESLKKSYTNNKQFAVLKSILSEELNAENYESVFQYSSEGLDLFPAQPLVYLMNAKALNQQQKYNDAIDVLSMGLDFIIDESDLIIEFYNEYINSYTGLSNQEKIDEYNKKIETLKKESINE